MADELEEQGRIALQQRQMVDQLWKRALDATANPPPDPGFTRRLLATPDAAEQQAAAFRLEDSLGFGWRSKPGARNMQLSYELRPGARTRPRPIQLWERVHTAGGELR